MPSDSRDDLSVPDRLALIRELADELEGLGWSPGRAEKAREIRSLASIPEPEPWTGEQIEAATAALLEFNGGEFPVPDSTPKQSFTHAMARRRVLAIFAAAHSLRSFPVEEGREALEALRMDDDPFDTYDQAGRAGLDDGDDRMSQKTITLRRADDTSAEVKAEVSDVFTARDGAAAVSVRCAAVPAGSYTGYELAGIEIEFRNPINVDEGDSLGWEIRVS